MALSVAIPKGEFDPNNPDPETAYVYYTVVEPSLKIGGLAMLRKRPINKVKVAIGLFGVIMAILLAESVLTILNLGNHIRLSS